MPRFIHAADVHLDSPMRGLQDYSGAPLDEVRGATRVALEKLVDLAIERAVDLVLFAGDLYDGDWQDYNTGLHFAGQMSRLQRHGVKAAVIFGNHDAVSQITKYLRPPDNVHLFGDKAPESVEFRELGLAVHGMSFGRRHVEENLALLYPAPLPGVYNIGLLHTSVNGRPGHDPYAPCTLEHLEDRGYQYWALGHIHQREVLCEDPWVVFPGNLQGRHIRETGPKGCTLVTVEDGEATVEERELDVVRWEECRVGGEGCSDPEDVADAIVTRWQELLDDVAAPVLATRVVVTGRSRACERMVASPEHWLNELRSRANDVGAGRLWLEKLQVVVPAAAETTSAGVGDPSLLETLFACGLTDADLAELAASPVVAELLGKLPEELRRSEDGFGAAPDALRELVPRAEAYLRDRLAGGGEGR